jgi:hypothetical protein
LVNIPINENTRLPLAGAPSEKLPLASVTAPVVVPFTTTDTPGSGLPSSADVTFPVTVRPWAQITDQVEQTRNKLNSKRFFMYKNFELLSQTESNKSIYLYF